MATRKRNYNVIGYVVNRVEEMYEFPAVETAIKVFFSEEKANLFRDAAEEQNKFPRISFEVDVIEVDKERAKPGNNYGDGNQSE